MSNFRVKNWPPIPKIPKDDVFHHGITTRVMATKQILQLQNENSTQNERRRSSKFLSGTSIPNSTIRSTIASTNKIEICDEIKSAHSSKSSNNLIEEQINKSRLSEERGMERMRKKIRGLAVHKGLPNKTKKEERSRSISTTFDLELPKRQTRRSTLESIKDAIDKSCDHGIKLVNADSIERKNIGQHFKVMTSLESFPMTKTDNKYSAYNDSVQGNVIQKQDLQTQTSLQLEKLLAQMSQNKRSN